MLPEPPAENADGDDEATPIEYAAAMRKLDCYFLPNFRKRTVREAGVPGVVSRGRRNSGPIQFPTQLRRQSENCGWDNPDEAIRDQVIDKCSSPPEADREGH